MSELIVATGQDLVHLEAKDGRWHASRLPSGRGMQCLAADPRDPDVLYAGSRGDGVWKRTRRGRALARLDFPEAEVFSLAVSLVDGAVYAGTEPSRLFVSRDEGRSWRELRAPGDTVPTELEFSAAPLDQPCAIDRPLSPRRPTTPGRDRVGRPDGQRRRWRDLERPPSGHSATSMPWPGTGPSRASAY